MGKSEMFRDSIINFLILLGKEHRCNYIIYFGELQGEDKALTITRLARIHITPGTINTTLTIISTHEIHDKNIFDI